MKPRTLHIADLFCGAGGTSTGALQAATQRGYQVNLTAINHWPIAIATHEANHPGTRHLCTSIDDVNPRTLFKTHGLDVLWASPECTHHSRARGGKPMHDQSRATAWCVTRWAEALLPGLIFVENVPYRVRLRWRMLQPHELARGMSFPSDYRFTGTKTDTVKQIGNAVCPEIARALLAAHL